MAYSEAAYFEGNHCHHCAAWEEHKRLERKRMAAIAAYDANRNRRAGLI